MKVTRNVHQELVCDVDEMNQILQNANERSGFVKRNYLLDYDSKANPLRAFSYIHDAQVKFSITTIWGKSDNYTKPVEYIFYKDGTTRYLTNATEAYTMMMRTNNAYKKIKRLDEMPEEVQSHFVLLEGGNYANGAKPLLWADETRDHSEQFVYVYDLNSAYAWAMIQPQPDTTAEYVTDTECPENYIGFNYGEELTRVEVGQWCDIAFPAIPSPFEKFARKWYEIKKHPKDAAEKAKAKNILVMSVGFLQRTQPFLRANIVDICNNYMSSLADENTVMINTDAIYSLTPRTLTLGDGLGEFKVEYEGIMRRSGFNYQLVDENGNVTVTKYRGIASEWFRGKDINILKDALPKAGNAYYFDGKILRRA